MGKVQTQNGPVAGRFSTEHRDCTVNALANCTGIQYAEAHSILAQQGRENGKGFSPRIAETRKAFEGRFFVHEVVSYGTTGYDTTLAQFAKAHWCGSFYVSVQIGKTSRHMVAVVNGVVLDNLDKSYMRSRVRVAWEFERRLSYQAA